MTEQITAYFRVRVESSQIPTITQLETTTAQAGITSLINVAGSDDLGELKSINIPVNEPLVARIGTMDPESSTQKIYISETPVKIENGLTYEILLDSLNNVNIIPMDNIVAMNAVVPVNDERVTATFINKTGQTWLQFVVAQFSSITSDIISPVNFQIDNFIKTVGGLPDNPNVSDWNTIGSFTVNLIINTPIRFIGIMPPNDPQYPLRGVVNLDPFFITDTRDNVFEIYLDECKTRLIVGNNSTRPQKSKLKIYLKC